MFCKGATRISVSKFKGNKATGATAARSFGGAIRSYGELSIYGSLFEENFAYNHGGAAYCDEDILITGSNFTDNTANVDGGAVYGNDDVTISESVFNNNQATGDTAAKSFGGAVHSEEFASVDNSQFNNNFAYNRGGAVYADKVMIKSCSFTGNSVKDYGGAVYTNTISKTVSNSQFSKNKVTGDDGGAIYINKKCSPEFESCIFTENTAKKRGGGIYLDSLYSYLRLSDCTFISNSAKNGGAVFAHQLDQIFKSVFLKNHADDGNGGGLYIENDDPGNYSNFCKFTSCSFEENKASNIGGAIYQNSKYADLYISYCTFVDNHADKNNYGSQDSYFYYSPGHSVYNTGYYKSIDMCWFGKNNPNFKGELAEYHTWADDEDHKPSNYLKIHIKLNETSDIYIGNTYKCTVYFESTEDDTLKKDLLHSNGTFYGEGAFYNEKLDLNEMTADVVFSYEDPTISGKLDNQVVSLNPNVKEKNPRKVLILSCENVTYPNPLKVKYQIINMSNDAEYAIMSKGTIVKNGKITDSSSTLTVNGLDVGEYSISINNPESSTTSASSASAGFKVTGFASVNVTADNVTYGNPTTLTLKADYDGLYTVKINDTTIEMNVAGGICQKQVNLDAGNYQTHTSKENYVINCKEASFKVDKAMNNVLVEVENVTYGELSNIKLKADLDGIYNIKINGTSYSVPVQNGIGNKSIQLKAGKYSANASFYNKNYNSIIHNTTFEVYKADIDLVLIVFDEVYGDKIEAIVYASTDGEYNLTVAGDLTHITVKDNLAYFEHGFLDAGNYTATVSFAGNNNYNPASYNTTFTVYPAGTSFKLEVHPSEISYGGTAIVTPIISKGATGTIKYYLNNGTFLGELDVSENLTLPVLDVGQYVIIGNYSGDNDFTPALDTTFLKVKPAQNNANVTVSNVTYGEKSLIEITANVDGIYQVTVNGTVYNVTVNNGVGNRTIAFDAGLYCANVSFDNRHYNTTTHNTIFEVYKADTNLIVVAAYSVYHEGIPCIVYFENIMGVVYSDVDGEYNLTVGDYSTVINVREGFCEFNAGLFDVGNHTILVTFSGDENHKSNSSSTNVNVVKFSPTLSLSVQDIYYGDSALLVINCDVTGSVNISVNGKTETIDLNQGSDLPFSSASSIIKSKTRAFLTLDNLNVGNYPVDIVYNGNNNIESTKLSGQFNVNPAHNVANVSVSNVTYGNSSLIKVSADVDGIYQLNVNGTPYNITVNGGVGNKSIALNAGSYFANVSFNNNNYNTSTHNTTFTVYKADIDLLVVVFDEVYGDYVECIVYSNLDDKYNLTIAGHSTFVTVKDNYTYFEYGTLDVGTYEANVSFTGNHNFNSAFYSTKFTVYPANSSVNAENVEVTYGDSIAVVVSSENATGISYQVIGVGGVVKEGMVNVGENITGLDLGAGEYAVNLTTLVNGNYTATNYTSKITVNPANSSISATDIEMTYGETIGIPVSVVNASAFYYAIVNEKGVTVDSNIIQAGLNITVENLSAGKYNVTLIAVVDSNHTSMTNTSKITVNPTSSSVSADDVVASIGDTVSIPVSSVNATEISYTITDTNNKSVVNGTIIPDEAIIVSDLAVGNYTVSLTTVVDTNHTSISNSSKLRIRHVVIITITPVTGYTGEVVNFTAQFKYENGNLVEKGTAGLTIKYDEREVLAASKYTILSADETIPVSGGKAVFTIKLGNPGTYLYVITYSGNDVADVQAESTLTILKVNTTVSGVDLSGKPSDKKDITFTVLDQNKNPVTNGTVTLTLNGKPYQAIVEKGKANITITLPNPGSYSSTITYNGNDYYLSSTSSITVDVKKVNTKVSSTEDISGKACEKTDIKIKIIDEYGNPVKKGTATLTVDGKTYTSEVINGIATFKDVVLPEKDTVAVVSYHENDYYNASSATFSIKVKHDNNNTEPDNNNTYENKAIEHISSKVDGNATGNPISIILLALFSLFIIYRKKL